MINLIVTAIKQIQILQRLDKDLFKETCHVLTKVRIVVPAPHVLLDQGIVISNVFALFKFKQNLVKALKLFNTVIKAV